MNKGAITKRFLNCLGFTEYKNSYTQKLVWAWGTYTVKNELDGQNMYIPIVEWEEETQTAYANPLKYFKQINSACGMEQFINNVSFLMSNET